MLGREGEDGKAFGEVFFGPSGEFWLGFGVVFEGFGEAEMGVGKVVGVENGLDVRGDLAFEVLFGDVVLCVLLEEELAALPRG